MSPSPVITIRFSILVSDTPPFTIYRWHKKKTTQLCVIILYGSKLPSTALKHVNFSVTGLQLVSILGAKYPFSVIQLVTLYTLIKKQVMENSSCYWSPGLNRPRYADQQEFQALPRYKSGNKENSRSLVFDFNLFSIGF